MLDAVLDATTDGVAVVDATGHVVDANDALCDLLDVDRDAVVDADWQSLFVDAPDEAALVDGAVDAALATDDGEHRLAVGTVSGRPVSASASRAGDRLVVTVTDRTPAVERDRFESILESVDDGIYRLDADGRIEYINQAALDAHEFSYDRDDVVGAFATAVLPADDIEACIDAIQSLVADADATSEQVPVTVEDADGTGVPAELNLALLPSDDDGHYAGSVGVLRDVTERRRRDQMLRVLNRVLRHNLRNDMNVVLGMTQLVDAECNAVGDYTDRIEYVAENLVELGAKANVVEELTGLDGNAPESADVVSIVEHAVDTVVPADGNVTVDAPESAVASVPPLFEVAVENVVENAFEHDDDPTVDVVVRRRERTVAVAVTDDGPGLPAAELDALRSQTETPLEHASGLGLWLTDWIVDFADGTVTYDVDAGTTVTIELPRIE